MPTPETGILPGGERYEQAAEARAATADATAGPVVPPPLPQPLTAHPIDPVAVPPPLDTNPAIAGDEDVIEKEWVDKAKQIIMETKDDPFARTAKVNELQKDYLKKRYNKELGADS